LGHLSRTLALCEHLNTNQIAYFIDWEQQPSQQIIDTIPYKVLSPTKTKEFFSVINPDDVVILDSYKIEESERTKIRTCVKKIIAIVDFPQGHYQCDALIQMTGFKNLSEYSTESYTRLFFGYQYALLKKVFFRPLPHHERKGILVSMGGKDEQQVTIRVMEAILNSSFANPVHVIYTPYFETEEIKKMLLLSENHNNVFLHSQLSPLDLCDLMDKCRYAVLPASTILLEALKRQVICAFGYTAENQLNNYNSLKSLQVGFPLENFSEANIYQKIQEFVSEELPIPSHFSETLGSRITELVEFILT